MLKRKYYNKNKRNMKKRLIPIIIILIIILLYFSDKARTFWDNTRFTSYLEKKYGEEFEYIGRERVNTYSFLSTSTREVARCYPKDGDKEKDVFLVRREKENKRYVYEDQYFFNLIKGDYTSRIGSVIDKQFDSYKMITLPNDKYFGPDIDETKSLDDAIDEKVEMYYKNVVLVSTTCTDEEFEKKTESISKEMGSLKLPMSLTIFYSATGNLDDIYTNDYHAKMYRGIYVSRDYEVEIDDVYYNKN